MATPHNSAPKGAFAKTVLMPGDPLRAKLIADNYLQDVKLVTSVRNIYGYTGTYKGVPVSVMASGMGIPSIGIYSWELFTQYDVENIIRIGSAGSYVERLDLLDVVLADSCFSDSSYAYVMNGYDKPVTYPSKHINEIITKKAQELGIECKHCQVYSSDAFYAGTDYRELKEKTQSECVEMEGFALFHNASILGKGAACVLTISDSFVSERELSAEERQNSFCKMIELGLETAITL